MSEYLDLCLSGANVWASGFLLLMAGFWLLAILVGLDIGDFLNVDMDVDIDMDVDVDIDADLGVDAGVSSGIGFGMMALRFLNIGRVPLMVWLSVMAIAWWGVSMGFTLSLDKGKEIEGWFHLAQLVGRNVLISLALTKIITQPLRGKFDVVEPNKAQDMLGKLCVITTSEVTEKFGQAEYETDAAPLLLNVRANSGEKSLGKGDNAMIVGFDSENNTYKVTAAKA